MKELTEFNPEDVIVGTRNERDPSDAYTVAQSVIIFGGH